VICLLSNKSHDRSCSGKERYSRNTGKIYVTNDFIPQFFDENTSLPSTVRLNSAKGDSNFHFDAVNNTITVEESGLYFLQFSIQVFAATINQNSLPLKFELQRNGGTIVNSQTSFNNNNFDIDYATSTLMLEELKKGDKIRLVLSGPSPFPAGRVNRLDFASVAIFRA